MEQYNFTLQSAIRLKNYCLVQNMLKKKDIPISNFALNLAIHLKDSDMVAILLKDSRFCDDTTLEIALACSDENKTLDISYHILKQLKINLCNSTLFQAVKTGNINLVKLLVSGVPETSLFKAANIAADVGNIEMLAYFSNYHTVETANHSKNAKTLIYINIPPSWDFVEKVIKSNDFEMLEAITLYYYIEDLMTAACSLGKIRVIKYIKNKWNVCPVMADCLDAYYAGHYKVARQIYNIICEYLSKLYKEIK